MAASRRIIVSCTLALVSTVWAARLIAQAPAAAAPRLEDLFTVARLGDLAFSPDGRRLLYTVRTADLEKNETNTDIWLLEFPDQRPSRNIQLTRHPKADTSPKWRSDGNAFAFLSAREAGDGGESRAALYLMRATGGEAERLYQHETAIRGFAWSPDGGHIAFTAQEPEAAGDKAAKETGRDATVEDEPGAYTHLWLFDVPTRTARRLTSGRDYSVGSFDWSPDGTALAFAAAPSPRITDDWKSDVWMLSVRDTSAAPRRLTDNPGPDTSPQFSPDGAFVYYVGYESSEYRVGFDRWFRIPRDGGRPEDVTPQGDLQPSRYVLTPDGRAVFFEATTGTTRAMFYMELATRQPVRLSGAQGVSSGASYSADRRRVAFLEESPSKPAEIYAALVPPRPAAGALKNVNAQTRHNAHAVGWAVGLTDVLRWKSVDGREIEGLLVYPAGWAPGRRVPLIVKIHGGPSGVFVQNFQASAFNADAQRYAADGYAVLLPNPRGSSGYGDAGVRSVIGDWGGLDFQDIMTGVDTVIARGIAHPDSLGVMGWSYGGYMTAWTVTQTDRFKAAVAGAAITEPIVMWGTQDIVHVFEAYFGGGSPWAEERWETYQKSSPLAYIKNAKTPTLVIHGRNDPRVPPNQGLVFHRALRALDVPTELLWLPRTGHGPSEPGLQYETARRQKEWMDRWIRRGGKTAAE